MVVVSKPARKYPHLVLSLCLLVSGFGVTHASHAAVHAAVVTLENGDQITGEVRKMADGVLVFASSMFGEVNIPWRKVVKLVSDTSAHVQLNDGTQIDGQIVLDETGALVVSQTKEREPLTLARENVVAVNPPVVDPGVKYSGRLDFGGTANRGNSTDDQLNLNGELVATTPKDRYTLAVEAQEDKSAGVRTTSNRRVSAQYDLFLKDKNYLLFKAKTERDQFADLNSRNAIGAGYGYQFIDTALVKLSGEAGLSYVFENYVNEPRKTFPAMSLGLKYDRKFFDEKLIFFNNATMDSSLDGPRNTLLRNRMGIRVPIAKGLNVSTQFNVDYNNQPAEGKKKADSTVIVSVGYAY